MTSSREDPEILPDAAEDQPNLPDASPPVNPDSVNQQQPPTLLPLFDCVALDKLCHVAEMFQHRERQRIREEAELAEKRRLWAEQRAEAHRQYVFEVAKAYALELHSDQAPKSKDDDEEEEEEEEVVKGKSRFDDAKNAIKKRRRYSGRSSSTTCGGIELSMTRHRTAPTLTELCMRVLAENSEAIESLHLVPDHLKKKISSLVSDSSKVDKAFMQLLVDDSPSEVSVKNCVDLEEEDLTQILSECDRVSLEVLNLDLCGRAMTENAITEFFKRSPNGFPSLARLSLQGAFCLTDNALALISRSAPLLRVINLCECSLLTFQAVKILADYFGSTLRGLNIGGCQGIKPCDVFRISLSRFEKLSSLSVAGLEGINDVVVGFCTSWGSNLTDLSLASCVGVNDGTLWTVGRYCPNLEALDISELDNLTDASLKEITDGCRSLNSVKFTRNRFSDEGVAAFLEVCGGSINNLSLNNVRDVGQETANSLAKYCKRLHYLDLSWCRKLTEEELRQIMSCCSLLRSLKLFGWTQVKEDFLEDLSRSEVSIVGLKMTSLFAHPDDSYPSVDAKCF
ncbi:PREDICTED: F-box/LRR-repeat protein 2 [Brassica oleracea var. oleracea]|uniref:F-box/LRR-repeat protein 15-like leucin rich repeat domain-containing protein n=1 Tax=Brassica oleracea var. oleracea TaxID=109376 RepID=A0A0D3B275_BRAOL|nr:PREDICTED: F-box/LRR-repeat protein 2 [Brassica oleracea var. oleracea]